MKKLKKVAESIPNEVKAQLKLDELVKNCSDYGITLENKDNHAVLNVMVKTQEQNPAGVMLHSALCLLSSVKKALNLSTDDISCFIYNELDNVIVGEI